MTIKNNEVLGNLYVSRDLTAGGGINAKGDSVFAKGLRVEGWLDAPNIRGAYKGLFKFDTDLKRKYPNPQLGWWALVGDNLPAEIYMVGNTSGELEWEATGNMTTGIEIDAGEFSERFDELHELLSQESEQRESADSDLQTTIENNVAALQQGINVVQRNLNEESNIRIGAINILVDKANALESSVESLSPMYFDVKHLVGETGTVLLEDSLVQSFVTNMLRYKRKGYLKGIIGNTEITIPVDNLYRDGNRFIFSYIIGFNLYIVHVVGNAMVIQEKISLSGFSGTSASVPQPFITITPAEGDADTKTIKTTIIKLRHSILSYDAENIKMIHPNGVAFLGHGGGTYTVENNTMIINWNFDAVEGEYELRIPRGTFDLNTDVLAAINVKYNVTLAPIVYFAPEVSPIAGNVSSDVVKKMTLIFPSEIDTFDGANVRLMKNFGNVWYDYAAKGTISEDRKSMVIEWDFVPEVGLTYTLDLPEGCITLKNGDKNAATQVEYVIT